MRFIDVTEEIQVGAYISRDREIVVEILIEGEDDVHFVRFPMDTEEK